MGGWSDVHLKHFDFDFLDDSLDELDHLLLGLLPFPFGGLEFVTDFLGDHAESLDDFLLLDFPLLLLPLEKFSEVIELLDELLVDLLFDVFSLIDLVLQVVSDLRQVLVQVIVDIGMRVLLGLGEDGSVKDRVNYDSFLVDFLGEVVQLLADLVDDFALGLDTFLLVDLEVPLG
jgi:hypothetical protein